LGLFIHIPWACSFTFVGPVFLNPDRVPAISLAASLLHYNDDGGTTSFRARSCARGASSPFFSRCSRTMTSSAFAPRRRRSFTAYRRLLGPQ